MPSSSQPSFRRWPSKRINAAAKSANQNQAIGSAKNFKTRAKYHGAKDHRTSVTDVLIGPSVRGGSTQANGNWSLVRPRARQLPASHNCRQNTSGGAH